MPGKPLVKRGKRNLSGLSAQQELFAQKFVELGSVYEAMKAAGYSEESSRAQPRKMQEHPLIAARIEELRMVQTKAAGLTANEVIMRVVRIAEEAERDKNWNAALKAYELVGKNLAMWSERQIIEGELAAKNPFATGDSPEDIRRDVERLMQVAAPKLKVVGGTEATITEDSPATPIAEDQAPQS